MAQLVVKRSEATGGRYRYTLPSGTKQGRVIHAKLAVGRLSQVTKVEGDGSVGMLVTALDSTGVDDLDKAVQAAIRHGLDSNDYVVVGN